MVLKMTELQLMGGGFGFYDWTFSGLIPECILNVEILLNETEFSVIILFDRQ